MKKALVLAAGLGTRLQPFTRLYPKALMPLWGVPLLEAALRRLESWGVEEVAVNVHAHADQVKSFLRGRKGKARIRVSEEREILGTGGALRPLRSFFGDAPFWVMNADVVASVDPAPLREAFAQSGGFAAVWLDPKRGPRTVEADRKRRITCFHSETPGVPGTYTFCGLHLLSPEIFTYLPETGFSTVIQAYEAAMAEGRFVVGAVDPKAYWADCGTPESYRKIHAEVKALAFAKKPGGEAYVGACDRIPLQERHFFCVCPGSKVPADVKGVDSVVLPGTEILPGTRLRDCVLAGGRYGGSLSKQNVAAFSADGAFNELSSEAAAGWSGVQMLGARGSNRSFWRLFDGERRAIGISYSEERPENKRYAGHARLLADAGVPVPEVLADDAQRRVLLLEDWGDDNLQARVNAKPYDAVRLYTPVVQALAAFHRDGTRLVRERGTGLEPAFDAALYAWERDLFARHLLADRFGMGQIPDAVERELLGVAERLLAQEPVVIHRDMQSSNVLMRGARFVFIDFQGMRFGSAAYDLASLLYDPYVKICETDRVSLAAVYAEAFPEQAVSAGDLLPFGAVQRLTQALGAYGRLASVGQGTFTRYVYPALERLHDLSLALRLTALHELCETLLKRERMRPDSGAHREGGRAR